MKMHLNLATSNIEASIAFYSTLLNAQPVKAFDDYALFITERPGLELALDAEHGVKAPSGGHFGIVVETTAAVEEHIARLTGAGYAVDVERESVCCYANQTKVWASDPDGRRWETYVVHADTGDRDDVPSPCCT